MRLWRENTGASALAAHGLPTDAALVHGLAATAARGPHSTWCITITDGHAIAHGCARPARDKRKQAGAPQQAAATGPGPSPAPPVTSAHPAATAAGHSPCPRGRT